VGIHRTPGTVDRSVAKPNAVFYSYWSRISKTVLCKT